MMTAPSSPHPSPPPLAGEGISSGAAAVNPPLQAGERPVGETRPDGWLIIDKPQGITSARVVALVKRATGGAKIGHAGTLDPLATGILPLALGEATKTVQCLGGGHKRYRFRIRWGVATDTDDSDGAVVGESEARPDAAAINAALPAFVGTIQQRPPAYSAIKLGGKRAYALARAGKPPELAARTIAIHALTLLAAPPELDCAEFEAAVGEGTYIRSLARDLAAALGTLGHIVALRRTAVGRFSETQAISLDSAVALGHSLAASKHLLPIETALDDIPALAVTAEEAARLRHGQKIVPRDSASGGLAEGALVGARHDRLLVALARAEAGCLRPVRIINR